MQFRNSRKMFWRHWLVAPIIWAPFPFVLVLDLFMELYHQLGFRLCNMERVNRSAYIQVLDRGRLEYLNWLEKIGCMYCGYINGIMLYWGEICQRTENYWCGIMHEKKSGFQTQKHQVEKNFSKFNNRKDHFDKYKEFFEKD
jgi:hypothetical protein